ncbi:transposase [Shewanella algae]
MVCLINRNPDDCSGIANLANKIKRQEFGRHGVAVSVSSNSSHLIMSICLGRCASSGKTEALVTPLVNKDAMILHLELISLTTESDRHAVVIIDGAGWHTMDTAMPFSNLTLINLPAYFPKLNPMEQV